MKTFMELLWVFMDVLQCSCFVLDVHTKNKRFGVLIQSFLVVYTKSCFVMNGVIFQSTRHFRKSDWKVVSVFEIFVSHGWCT